MWPNDANCFLLTGQFSNIWLGVPCKEISHCDTMHKLWRYFSVCTITQPTYNTGSYHPIILSEFGDHSFLPATCETKALTSFCHSVIWCYLSDFLQLLVLYAARSLAQCTTFLQPPLMTCYKEKYDYSFFLDHCPDPSHHTGVLITSLTCKSLILL